MPVQQTSIDAFLQHQAKLNYQQEMILSLLKIVGEANNSMIVQSTGLPINVVTPRVNELRKKGLVVLSKIEECPITHRRTMWWRPRNDN